MCDGVVAPQTREFGRIRTGPTIDAVVATATGKGVIAVLAIQGVVASVAVEFVGDAAAHDEVIAVAPQHVFDVEQ